MRVRPQGKQNDEVHLCVLTPHQGPSPVEAQRLNPSRGAAETSVEALQQLVLDGVAGGGTA
jgi:hypothetical protein